MALDILVNKFNVNNARKILHQTFTENVDVDIKNPQMLSLILTFDLDLDLEIQCSY